MCLAFAWCLSDLRRTDFSPSSGERMAPTDITLDMRVRVVYINEISALMRQSLIRYNGRGRIISSLHQKDRLQSHQAPVSSD